MENHYNLQNIYRGNKIRLCAYLYQRYGFNFSTLVSLELSVAIENKSDTISLARSSFNFGANASLKILNFFSNIRSRYFLRNTESKMQMTLHKICQNTGFSLTRILPYKDRIYDLIFLDCLEVRC